MAMTSLAPPPEVFGAMRAGDIDSRARDWTGDLAELGDTVASVVAVQIDRVDAQPVAGGLVYNGTPIINGAPVSYIDATGRAVTAAAGLVTTIGLTASNVAATYVVGIKITTQQGRTLSRDGYLTVTAALG